jgi:hypothetical protein
MHITCTSNALATWMPMHIAAGCRGESMKSSLDEMEFLKTFDGDEETINHHFITLEI